jgi:hypothetical protein
MKEIQLTQGKVALVDDEDYERLAKFKWYAAWTPSSRTWYARRRSVPDRKMVHMHREVLRVTSAPVDHINHDGLDNRRANLRLCTQGLNLRNTRKRAGCSSQYKGVSWIRARQLWCACIEVNGRTLHLGKFTDEREAAAAYDRAAQKHFGEFALTNGVACA